MIHIVFVEHQGRFELQDIFMDSISAHQYMPFAHHGDDIPSPFSILLSGLLILDDINSLEKSCPTDIPNKAILLAQLLQLLLQIVSRRLGVLLQLLLLNHIQHAADSSDSKGVAPKSTKQLDPSFMIAIGDLFRTYHS